jgi:preprotein translocase subunit SecD
MSEEKITQVEKTANELGVSVSKIEAVAEENTVITVPKKKNKTKASAEAVINDTIGSSIPVEPKKEEVKKQEPKKQKVALYSSRNVYWEGVGEVQRGYNFVTPEQAEKWATRIHIRIATPEEIKEVFDN